MTELDSKEILEQVYFERYKNGVQYRVLSVINGACNRVKEELRKTDGVYTKARYREVEKALRQVAREVKESMDAELDVESVIDYEIGKQSELLREYGNLVDLTLPTAEQIVSAIEFKPIVNMTYQSYLNGIEANFYNVWDTEVRTGYLTGETTQAIIRKVMGRVAGNAQLAEVGKMQALRNSVTANTRTALQAFANETRMEVFRRNDDLFTGYRWVSTLDRRTCIVCGQYDGHVFRSTKKLPDIPLHINCRCLVIPVVKGGESFTDTRASEGGQVDIKITFEDWLKMQPKSVQKDVLGATRYELFAQGKADLKTFISDNKVLTLDDLRKLG